MHYNPHMDAIHKSKDESSKLPETEEKDYPEKTKTQEEVSIFMETIERQR